MFSICLLAFSWEWISFHPPIFFKTPDSLGMILSIHIFLYPSINKAFVERNCVYIILCWTWYLKWRKTDFLGNNGPMTSSHGWRRYTYWSLLLGLTTGSINETTVTHSTFLFPFVSPAFLHENTVLFIYADWTLPSTRPKFHYDQLSLLQTFSKKPMFFDRKSIFPYP